MNFCILMASPRAKGNTVELLKPFLSELESNQSEVTYNGARAFASQLLAAE